MPGLAVVPTPGTVAKRFSVTGIVQGVGFRPFVHRLAERYGLDGWVRNTSGDVDILVEGPATGCAQFRRSLERESPTLAVIHAIVEETVTVSGLNGFRILHSEIRPQERQPVAPDVALCAQCEAEMYQPGNRRFRYPFITCTDCGPRISVVEDIPYDRNRTSMRRFTQCAACQTEYSTPQDRRYHSETNSCPSCGPTLVYHGPQGDSVAGSSEALSAAARALVRGSIMAVRGLGGFHLAVDATNDQAVHRLRQRKRRDAKPFAVMVRSLAGARRLARLTEDEEALLVSAARPIVVVARVTDTVSRDVAPGLDTIGLMLSYTPLHHLLLDLVDRPLVMTSGNESDEPIAAGNREAGTRLGHIADAFLVHDRDIVNRHDDSVVRSTRDGAPIVLRRARGDAPRPIRLPVPTAMPLVAVGPHLKNTFTLAQDQLAFVSQHLGDLENLATLQHFQDTLARYRRLFRIEPAVAVRDAHPGYLSTRVAEEMGLRVISVQHHHAHVAAVMGEHGLTKPVIGVAYDGTGHGDDGTVWGAEMLVADLRSFQRVGHLVPAPLPGGDLAVKNPWRTALGYRSLAVGDDAGAFSAAVEAVDAERVRMVEQQLDRGINSPMASSMGRLFDAAASVLGLRHSVRYEGQAAMELECLAGALTAEPLPYGLQEVDGRWQVDPVPILVALGRLRSRGQPAAALAAAFHETIADATAAVIARIRDTSGIDQVVLSGGSFQNARLHYSLRRRLSAAGCRVYVPRVLSPNDGAVSYGQAVVAAAQMSQESPSCA